MALLFAGITTEGSRPNVGRRTYTYTRFNGDEPGTSDNLDRCKDAWKHVQKRAGMPTCSAYFHGLTRHRTLRQVLDEGPITLWLLHPVEGYTEKDVPLANSAGRDIGIKPVLLEPGNQAELACTLIHELAHVAGASTNKAKEDPHSLDAEKALKKCACGKKYNEDNLGYHILTQNAGKFRIV